MTHGDKREKAFLRVSKDCLGQRYLEVLNHAGLCGLTTGSKSLAEDPKKLC